MIEIMFFFSFEEGGFRVDLNWFKDMKKYNDFCKIVFVGWYLCINKCLGVESGKEEGFL